MSSKVPILRPVSVLLQETPVCAGNALAFLTRCAEEQTLVSLKVLGVPSISNA